MSATYTLQEILKVTGGQCTNMSLTEGEVFSISTDTRAIGDDKIFLALKGERFDGHNFVEVAYEAGAHGVIVSKESLLSQPTWQERENIIAVDDPLEAYLKLAHYHLKRIKPTVLAITGSSGKTTVKDMMLSTLSKERVTHATEKNFNNEIGLCQTLMALREGTELLIVEMAMRGLRQISILSQYCPPDIAVIINIGPAHIGLLGSLENIAKAKCEIFEGMDSKTGVGVVNGDDSVLMEAVPKYWSGGTIAYKLSEVNHLTADRDGCYGFDYHDVSVQMSVPGRHQVQNALAVFKVAEKLEIEPEIVANALSGFEPQGGRWNCLNLKHLQDCNVIHDAYNANPQSVKASLAAFFAGDVGEQKRIVVLGGMKELGDLSEKYHQELAEFMKQFESTDLLLLVGEETEAIGKTLTEHVDTLYYPTMDAVVEAFEDGDILPSRFENAVVFLKGSRAYKLEMLIELLEAKAREVLK